jgi:hypothetical protein
MVRARLVHVATGQRESPLPGASSFCRAAKSRLPIKSARTGATKQLPVKKFEYWIFQLTAEPDSDYSRISTVRGTDKSSRTKRLPPHNHITARPLAHSLVKSPNIGETVRNHRDDFIAEYSPPRADGQIRRAATRFGLAAAAGELATALQITGWEAGEATRAASACFQAWLARRGHTGPAEIQAGIEQVRRFFALHGESRFTAEDRSANGRPVINRAGFRKDGCFWVFPAIFRSEIAAGFEWHSLAAALVERGMLSAGTDGKIQRPVRNPDDNKAIRMLCFTPAVIADEEPSENLPKEAFCDED